MIEPLEVTPGLRIDPGTTASIFLATLHDCLAWMAMQSDSLGRPEGKD